MKTKKIFKSSLAIILTLLTVFGGSVGVTAVESNSIENTVVAEDKIDEAVIGALEELIGSDDNIEITSTDINEENGYDLNKDGDVTFGEISKVVSKYMILPKRDIDKYSDIIADNATYHVEALEDGTPTVYISVDLEKCPQLVNLAIFGETVMKLAEKQKVYSDESFTLMDYRHIAGELAIHGIISVLLCESDSELYDKAKIADLNVDESRLPIKSIRAFGFILMDIVHNIYNLYVRIISFIK